MKRQVDRDGRAKLLGQTMAEARRAAGLQQEEAAAISGRGRQLISTMENGGVAEPSAEVLARLADAYGVDVIKWFSIIGYSTLARRFHGASINSEDYPSRKRSADQSSAHVKQVISVRRR